MIIFFIFFRKNFISIVDLVGVLSESDRPWKYWSDLKSKLKKEENEVFEKIGQLNLKSQDGKCWFTDVCDIKEQEKYFISVVDIVGVISESKDKQAYWRKLKQRLKGEENEIVTNCHALKLKVQDGKYRMTDVVDNRGNV